CERAQLGKLAAQLLDLPAQLFGLAAQPFVIALVPRGHLIEVAFRHSHGGGITGADQKLAAIFTTPRRAALASGPVRFAVTFHGVASSANRSPCRPRCSCRPRASAPTSRREPAYRSASPAAHRSFDRTWRAPRRAPASILGRASASRTPPTQTAPQKKP